ncbi:hypothetical protein VIBNISOn1_1350002 [Vibrio nigripulchritudo SOn1]|uniref:Uncharacterized protein n=1 Tax=Vibrio nigripulchritudo SOn1 TaxID=1238450 RepID=A0AAV2VJZ1_9VIBR|nr:hypothetical protein [Vibrio nigripulchritudo]CCO45038.1 hypothetical protein VIBNISOn1_1350002 [Vibrio nigripulchritudo SOn1]
MQDFTLEEWKNVFNIGFFLAMSTIAVLSYVQARKTLFSPIKTEIFKLQVEEIKKVLEVFNHKHQSDFDQETGIQEVFEINAREMHMAYINCFFKDQVEPPVELIEKLKSAHYGAIISEKHASKFFVKVSAGEEIKQTPQVRNDNPVEPALKLAKWNEYEHGMINFTKKYNDATDELAKLASSPLLPKELTDKIYKVIGINNKNLSLIGDILTDAAKKMPTQYKTVEQAISFQPTWIWNEYNNQRESTNQSVSDILSYINKHLKINEIMK